jgi:hypothetical protein
MASIAKFVSLFLFHKNTPEVMSNFWGAVQFAWLLLSVIGFIFILQVIVEQQYLLGFQA